MLQRELDAVGRMEWTLWCIDGSHVRAHKAAAGAGKNPLRREPADHALGRSRGGFGTKLHLATDGRGLPLAIAVSPTQAHESLYVEPVLNAVRIARPLGAPGRPRRRPDRVAGDRGYSVPRIRRWLRAHHIGAVIPERRDQVAHRHGRPPVFDRAAYRRRSVIECCVGWLKESRRIATRCEKLAVHYLGVLKLGMIQRHLQLALSHTP